jgi:hypothetical protein
MIELHILIALVLMHFVADFIFQSDYIAINKSSNSWVLALHVFLYSIPFAYFGVAFAVVTFVLHFVTDYISSRVAGNFWKNEQRHWFFVTIGADQAVHMISLFAAYVWLVV